MRFGKIVFAQLMNFMPEYGFHKCIKRHKGNAKVSKNTCREHYLPVRGNQLSLQESEIMIEFLCGHQ